jgi:acyl-CoA synthetase (AMP-forming)/AMP-acid ligase II
MNISELFISAAKAYPNKVAIIDPKGSITYSALEKEVKETAAYFQKKGIKKGDRVLVFVPMRIDLYRIVLALFYIGATAVFLDEWVNKKRLDLCCKLADCTGFIGVFKAQVYSIFLKELRQVPIKLKLKKKLDYSIPIVPVTPESHALITFTTGSTGTPKAANRTHEFLKHQFAALLDEIEPKADDIDMVVLPIVLFVNLGVGCTSVIANFKMTKPESIDVALIAKQIKTTKVNRITASPFFIKKLSEYALKSDFKFTNLQKIFTGGAPVFPNESALYLSAFPNANSTIVYGSTEAEPISSIAANKLSITNKDLPNGLPVGRVYHKTKLKIIKISEEAIPPCTAEALKPMTLEDGEIGEILVSGLHVLKQYYKNEAAFKANKIIVDNVIWHRTGDSGLIKETELFLTGRCSQLIKNTEGFLSPFIIENKLQCIEGINIGTIVEIENQYVLVVETELNLSQLKPLLTNIIHNKVVILNRIPRDLRHNSKIDYAKMKLMLTLAKKI